MLLFLLFVMLVFFGRVVLTSFVRFPLFFPCRFWRLTSGCQCSGGLTLVCTLFPSLTVFVAGLLLFFLLSQKNGVDMSANMSGSLPIGALPCLLLVSPSPSP